MSSGRENWLFTVKEIAGGDLCLSPEPKKDLAMPVRKKPVETVLDNWHIHFVLPAGTDHEDANRIADLLNEWVREVTVTARDSSSQNGAAG